MVQNSLSIQLTIAGMKFLLNVLILFLPFCSMAQKQGNIWYFGNQCGLDFSNGKPISISGGKTGTDNPKNSQEGTAVISDSAGHILFYTGGETIWNRKHLPMPNGSGLMGGVSSTQSSIIVPQPGNDSLFYVFTSDEFQSYPSSKGYRYSVVNMCLDNGYGDVLVNYKNRLLLDSATEKLAACRDISGNGYWIMGHKLFSDEFHAWHLTSSGISDTVVSHTGTVHGWQFQGAVWRPESAQGQMKFNPAGTKLALVIGNHDPAILELFDFNAATGVVSNACYEAVDSALQIGIYGVEFSAAGSKLYTTLAGGSGGKRIDQYDLTAGSCNAIHASRVTIFQSDVNSVMYGLQLAPTDKIYVLSNSKNDLGCINFPDLKGAAAQFDSAAVILSGTIYYALPSFVAGYKYNNQTVCCNCDTLKPADSVANIIIPTVFTPNNDGINDEWVVRNLQEGTRIELYDRWGLKVTTVDATDNVQKIYRWDGRTTAGKVCTSGVYYYIIIAMEQTYKGSIQLIR